LVDLESNNKYQGGNLKTSWVKTDGRRTDYIDIHYNEVVVGNHYGSGMTDNAGTCSHEEFLAGRFQDLILNSFGQKILNEIIDVVKLAKEGKIPEFQMRKEKKLEKKFFLESIPIDESLKDLDNQNIHPETISGYSNYGNKGNKSVIKSNKVKFVATKLKGYIENEKGEKMQFKLQGYLSGVVELNDYFYITYDDNFAVISPEGEFIFDTHNIKFDKESPMFGYDVRISNVYRNGNMIFFKYSYFDRPYLDGLIKYDLKKGFIGRWEYKK